MATPSSPSPPSPPPLLLPPPPPQDPDQNSDHHSRQDQPLPSNSPKRTPPIQSTSSPPNKTLPLPWTHEETINLIQAYQDKWYSLKKGHLKASQWEEVAIIVAARCGYDEPSKSAIQCRHKIEKLRKRYRGEKLKPHPNSWQYFDLMDRMERGPLAVSAQSMAMIQYQNPISSDNSEDSDSDVDYNEDSKKNKSKSINHIVRGGNNNSKSGMDRKLGGGSDRVLRVSRNPMFRKRKECYASDEDDGDDDQDDNEEEEEAAEGHGGSEVTAELAAEIRAFTERLVRMENKKIEMMRDMERYRMEMENKRMEMILESQQKIVEKIHRAFSSHKKIKMAQ